MKIHRKEKYLALLASLPFETEIVRSHIRNVHKSDIAGKTVLNGKLSNINVLLMHTGIGDVNSAHSATGIIEHFPIAYVINFGIGGAYPRSGLKIGDVAFASKEIYADKGVLSRKGQEGLRKIGIPLVRVGGRKYFNEFTFDKRLVKKVLKRITPAYRSGRHHALHPSPIPQGEGAKGRVISGNFLTVSSATGTYQRALTLEKKFNAVCENMEGAGIAQVCIIYGISMLEIRGMSNVVGGRDKRTWDLKLASENCQKAVLEILKAPV